MTSSEISQTFLTELFDNSVLFWGLIACGMAQISKLCFELLLKKQWRPSVLFETGGMPSSHSSLVTGTAAGVGWELGFSNPDFALAATIAFVVMYDASGIRRSAGLTAERVNQIIEKNDPTLFSKDLKESLGHTRMEVLVGSLFGPAIALPGIVFLGSPLHIWKILGLMIG
tara:strand:+ start:1985 stop:2497 length:513 start_codon:yes stop_codon:yes gene_type:complete